MLLKKVPKGSVVHIHQTRPDLILMKKKKLQKSMCCQYRFSTLNQIAV